MLHSAYRPLPGLVKLFLVQSYCWVACLFPAHIVFTLLQYERRFSLEAFLWGAAAMVVSIVAVAAITGIHTRSAWAPAVCRVFCGTCILAGMAVCARLADVLEPCLCCIARFQKSFPPGGRAGRVRHGRHSSRIHAKHPAGQSLAGCFRSVL